MSYLEAELEAELDTNVTSLTVKQMNQCSSKKIRKLMKLDVNAFSAYLNEKNRNLNDLLAGAVNFYRKDLILILIERGADINYDDVKEYVATAYRDIDAHKDMIDCLISLGLDIQKADYIGFVLQNKSYGILEFLLDRTILMDSMSVANTILNAETATTYLEHIICHVRDYRAVPLKSVIDKLIDHGAIITINIYSKKYIDPQLESIQYLRERGALDFEQHLPHLLQYTVSYLDRRLLVYLLEQNIDITHLPKDTIQLIINSPKPFDIKGEFINILLQYGYPISAMDMVQILPLEMRSFMKMMHEYNIDMASLY